MDTKKNTFLVKNKENPDFNQYWFSTKTIDALVQEATAHGPKVAFLSTPSVYFNVKDEKTKSESFVFDFDKKFAKDPNYVFYDFNKPEDIPEKFNGYFDLVLIDPPFITLDVWSKYAEAAKKIVKKDENGGIVGKIVGCSIEENAEMLQNLLGLQKRAFKPSIPNLIYQYTFYSNYESSILDQKNPEIDDS